MQNAHILLAFIIGSTVNYALCKTEEYHIGDIVKTAPGAMPGVVVDVAYDYSGDCLRLISRVHAIHTNLILVERGCKDV